MAMSFARCAIALTVWTAAACLFIPGCQMAGSSFSPSPTSATGAATSTAPAAAPALALFSGKSTSDLGGAELWAQTCNHCHNLRSPATYGPVQWEVALYDMRVRANLTGEEQRKILEFMKAASQ